MRNDTFYGVQFAQGLFCQLWKTARFEEIIPEVFSKTEDIYVRYFGEYTGENEVRQFFEQMSEFASQRGGLYRLDFPTTQYIEPGKDDEHVLGHFSTISYEFTGNDAGNKLSCQLGQFSNEFVLEDGIWRLKGICYIPGDFFGPWDVKEDNNFSKYLENPRQWVEDIPTLEPLGNLAASEKCMEILELRNKLFGIAYSYNETGQLTKLKDNCSSQVYEMVSEQLRKKAKLLVTSPVIKMQDSLKSAEAFCSLSVIKYCTDDEVECTRGSLTFSLTKNDSAWQIEDMKWYNYAKLDCWKRIKNK